MTRKKTQLKREADKAVAKKKQVDKQPKRKVERLKPRILTMGRVQEPIEKAGGSAVWIGMSDDRAAEAIRLGAVDGLLLTGGGDVNPLLYADRRDPRCYGVNAARDDAEWDAITAADEMSIPVLGICRGAQMINVAYGGTLHQHIPALPQTHHYHNGGDHRVKAAEGSRLQKAWGDEDDSTRWVVSIHHQAVDRLAAGFVATGWGLDGTIEAIECIEGWIVGVQFHPEMVNYRPEMQRIFDAFVTASAKAAGLKFTPRRHPDGKLSSTKDTTRFWMGEKRWEPMDVPIIGDRSMDTSIGVPVKTRQRRAAAGEPVLTRWRCFRCTIDFSERVDHVDHMLFLHGISVEEK